MRDPPTLVPRLDDVAVVSDPVEQRGGHLLVAEHLGPFTKGEVGGDYVESRVKLADWDSPSTDPFSTPAGVWPEGVGRSAKCWVRRSDGVQVTVDGGAFLVGKRDLLEEPQDVVLGVEKLCEGGFPGAIEVAPCAGHAVDALVEELVGATGHGPRS